MSKCAANSAERAACKLGESLEGLVSSAVELEGCGLASGSWHPSTTTTSGDAGRDVASRIRRSHSPVAEERHRLGMVAKSGGKSPCEGLGGAADRATFVGSF